MKTIHWGIAATGWICHRFASCMPYAEGSVMSAVASRSLDKAKAFASEFGIPKAYGSYAEMAEDHEIDAVYIGTPHTCHKENAIFFLERGIPVLCEKPSAVNQHEMQEIIDCARKNNTFFMEAMWTRYFPAIIQAEEWIKAGRIGEVKAMYGAFGDCNVSHDIWRFKADMAGGALLDVGIYPLSMCCRLFGTEPSEIVTSADVRNGIDEVSFYTLKYPDGKIASLAGALTVKLDNKIVISGTEGMLTIGRKSDWWRAADADIQYIEKNAFTGKSEQFDQPYSGLGYHYEINAVRDCLLAGKKEADRMTWDDSVKIAGIMEGLRKVWGVRYPADQWN